MWCSSEISCNRETTILHAESDKISHQNGNFDFGKTDQTYFQQLKVNTLVLGIWGEDKRLILIILQLRSIVSQYNPHYICCCRGQWLICCNGCSHLSHKRLHMKGQTDEQWAYCTDVLFGRCCHTNTEFFLFLQCLLNPAYFKINVW